MIVSDKGVRKIVQKKINEGGFTDRGTGRLGRESDAKCDLSNLDDTAFAAWFAKHFLFNAEGVTRKTLMGSIKNLGRMGRTAEEDDQYTRAVNLAIQRDPNIIKKYRETLELGIILVLGRTQGAVLCAFLNKIFEKSGAQKVSSRGSEKTSVAEIQSKMSIEYSKASRQFMLENPSTRSLTRSGIDSETAFLFPKASIALASGDIDKAREKFEEESLKMRDIIETPDQTKEKVKSRINDYYYGISGKRIILRNLYSFMDELEDTYENGDAVRSFLSNKFDESERIFSSNI